MLDIFFFLKTFHRIHYVSNFNNYFLYIIYLPNLFLNILNHLFLLILFQNENFFQKKINFSFFYFIRIFFFFFQIIFISISYVLFPVMSTHFFIYLFETINIFESLIDNFFSWDFTINFMKKFEESINNSSYDFTSNTLGSKKPIDPRSHLASLDCDEEEKNDASESKKTIVRKTFDGTVAGGFAADTLYVVNKNISDATKMPRFANAVAGAASGGMFCVGSHLATKVSVIAEKNVYENPVTASARAETYLEDNLSSPNTNNPFSKALGDEFSENFKKGVSTHDENTLIEDFCNHFSQQINQTEYSKQTDTVSSNIVKMNSEENEGSNYFDKLKDRYEFL